MIDISSESVEQLVSLLARGMRLNVMIQDEEVQALGGEVTVDIRPLVRQAAQAK